MTSNRKIRAEHVDLVSGKRELRRGLSQQRLAEKPLLLGLRASHTPFELKLGLRNKQIAFTHTLGSIRDALFSNVSSLDLDRRNWVSSIRAHKGAVSRMISDSVAVKVQEIA